MKVAVVYGNDGSDVRIAKTCRTLAGLGHEVHFIGWDRRPDLEKQVDLPGVTLHVVEHRVPHRRSTVSGQLAFTKHAIRTLLKVRPHVVHAVNEDNVLRIGALKGIAYRRLICDVFDSHLDKSSDASWPVRAVVSGLVAGTRWWSDRLIATDDVRFETFGAFRSKTVVIGNYPSDPGAEWAQLMPTGPAKVFASGTLSHSRGLEQLLQAADRVPDVRIVAAGWAADDFAANEFLNHPSVEFLGQLTPAESLQVAAECDALVAMYVPTCRNHILASPNKIYDALSVGRPVIINAEAKVSEWVTRYDVGFACPYTDSASLAGFLGTLLNRRRTLPEYARRARSLFQSGYSWEAMEDRLRDLYATWEPAASPPINPSLPTAESISSAIPTNPAHRRAA
ncbi:MAG: glycosyltransferase [Planctomycetaceae bacterium]|nr:glycosyltransferase [Planctomycetaceae bacterium]